MSLDERMSAIVSEVLPCRVVADIGCDHGIVAVELKARGVADKVIASDISDKSVQKARILAQNNGVDIDVRVGSGMSVLTDAECDTLIIAGMGGMLMADILRADGREYNKMILSPQSDVPYFRRFLADNGWRAVKDYKVLSQGKFYDIIVAQRGLYSLTEAEIEYGSGKGVDFAKFYEYERARLQFIIANADILRAQEMTDRLKLLDSVYSLNVCR